MFNKDEAQAFLQRRFGDSEGYVATAVRFPWKEHQFKWPAQESTILWAFEQLSEKRSEQDIYVCPILRRDEGRDKWNGLSSRTVFADLDGGTIPDPLLPCVELVNSGTPGHYHAYVTLTEAISVERLESLNFALAKVSNGDSKWANNTVLRLPGTTNYKNTPSLVTVEKLASATVTPENLEAYLKPYMPEYMWAYPTGAEIDALREVHIPSDINFYLQRRLNEDASGDRSSKSYHFIVACIEKRFPPNLIYSLALQHAPTVAKYGSRRDGIKNQVLTVIKNKQQRDERFLRSPLFRNSR